MRSMLAAVMPASPAAGRLPMAACRQMPSRGLGRPASSDSSPRRAALAANSRGVCRPDSQPSPNRTARRRAAADWPPIHNGGTGMAVTTFHPPARKEHTPAPACPCVAPGRGPARKAGRLSLAKQPRHPEPRSERMVKAVRFSRFGGPEVLEIVDLPDPHPGPGQVRIAVRAAGINPSDWKKRKGLMDGELPQTLAHEAARVVDELGAAGYAPEHLDGPPVDGYPARHVVVTFEPAAG